jgi:Raf kinase inhibitor-like YbhB/YbcL family protein
MKFKSSSFGNNARIPGEFAFGVPDAKTHVALSKNRNPAFEWRDAPAGTRSFALICHDYDVPGKGDDVNQEGRSVPPTLPRVDFYHWILVDLPADATSIAAGEFSDRVTSRGKPGPDGPRGTRQGINDYTGWFAADKDMAGNYFGYDGPCPPWNDTIAHHYVFTLYALDYDKCPLTGPLKGPEVLAAMRDHVLGQATWTGVYTLNPQVKV